MRLKPKGLILVMAILCVASLATAAERKITKSDLPPAVRTTAEQQSVGSTVTGYSKDIEGGKLEYEVQMTTRGHAKDVTIAPDGQLIEIEEQVHMSDLPADVKAALKTKAGKGKITRVESLAKHGAIVAYEAQVLTAGKHTEVQVGPDGKSLNHEE